MEAPLAEKTSANLQCLLRLAERHRDALQISSDTTYAAGIDGMLRPVQAARRNTRHDPLDLRIDVILAIPLPFLALSQRGQRQESDHTARLRQNPAGRPGTNQLVTDTFTPMSKGTV